MQKIFITISRMVFVSGVLILLLTVFGGVTLMMLNRKENQKIGIRQLAGEGVVLAAQNQLGSTAGQDIVADQIVADDARPLLIKKYLEKYKSPLLPYADMIISLSDTYKFDYYWIVAIAQQESNLCKKIPDNSFNCWGYGINSAGTLRFASYELALKSYAEYLKREYFDKGLNTPELIMKKYCPHSNGSWAFGVNQFIHEIENGS